MSWISHRIAPAANSQCRTEPERIKAFGRSPGARGTVPYPLRPCYNYFSLLPLQRQRNCTAPRPMGWIVRSRFKRCQQDAVLPSLSANPECRLRELVQLARRKAKHYRIALSVRNIKSDGFSLDASESFLSSLLHRRT